MSHKLNYRIIVVYLLIFLWIYAAVSKLLVFDQFSSQMSEQPLPALVQQLLAYLLPPVELSLAALLLIRKTEFIGLYASAGLLLVFTIYIASGVMGVFRKIPCSCGGILGQLGWTPHLILNSALFILTILVMPYTGRKEGYRGSF